MRTEVLSPCGGPESLAAALSCGADAIYLGAEKFSARHNAVNFTRDELLSAVRECHRQGVLVYLAVNTVVFDDEFEELVETLKLACEAPVDGLIVQDMAVCEMVKAACPDMPLHASTQMTVHTPLGALEAKDLGFTRVVAARELSLEAIREMCETGAEIEAFAHGALCFSVSGQCYLSAFIGGRSANRGLCAGACRLPFSAEGRPKDKYALSLKDLSYCGRVGELIDAGVCSLKIEGRMKRPEYVAAATDAMRKAVDGEIYNEEILRAVFSRSGFTDSYLDEEADLSLFGARQKEDVVAAKDALPELRRLYDKPRKRFKADMKLTAKVGEQMALELSDGELRVSVSGDIPETAQKRETTAKDISAQLEKLGGTIYDAGDISAEVGGGLYIPLSAINDLRRRGLEALDEARVAKYPPKKFDETKIQLHFPMPLILRHPRLRVRVERAEQLEKMQLRDEELIVPLREAEKFIKAGRSPKGVALQLTRFDVDERSTMERLKIAKSLGFGVVECGDLGHIRMARELDLEPCGGFGLNIANPIASHHYFERGIRSITVSPEIKAWKAGALCYPGRAGAVVYGRLPLMCSRACPVAAEAGCRNCKKRLTDRTGTEFPILCHKDEGWFELLNSRPMWLADKLDDFNLDFGTLYFTVETAEEAENILEMYREGAPAQGEFTRGLYYRGV